MRGFPRVALTRARALCLVSFAAASLAACTTSSHHSTKAGSGGSATSAPSSPVAATSGAPTPTASTTTHRPGVTASPPHPGTINQTVSSRAVTLLTAKPVGTSVTYRGRALTATVQRATRITAVARIPGEIAGPAVSVQLKMVNRGKSSVGLGSLVAITAQGSDGTPFSPVTTSTTAVSATLRPGASTVGRYVFHLPTGYRGQVTIQVTYAATAEVARFVGSV